MFPIGVFDSGYGGLTVLRSFKKALPEYDFIYLGDNARTPYGNRSFETVYEYTLECVNHLFNMGCRLVILACNTASAKALRTIQQNDLPKIDSSRRVLGVIRPTAEIIGKMTHTGTVGVFATAGTVQSESYIIEIAKAWPEISVVQEACPMWVPLIENNEHEGPGADYFVDKYVQELLAKSSQIDSIILGCTHYPLMWDKIREVVPGHIHLLAQGQIVADRLADYLIRHPEIDVLCRKTGQRAFFTTETAEVFDAKAGIFYGKEVRSRHFEL